MKMAAMISALLALSVIGHAQQASGEQPTQKSGTVCVLPNSAEAPTRISPGGNYNPATLTISIDQQHLTPWPHKHSVKIEDLDLMERHLMVLRSEGKRIQSFYFRFSKDTMLCVAFDGYQGVQLGGPSSAGWCGCR